MCKSYLVVIQKEENNYRLRGREVEKWELIIKNLKKSMFKMFKIQRKIWVWEVYDNKKRYVEMCI